VPLDDTRFQQRGGRVGVVFEQLRLAFAVPAEIEAAVQRRVALAPGLRHQLVEGLGDGELGKAPAAHHFVGRLEAELVQLRGYFFHAIDFIG
jgi:hypothetical protein